MGGEFSCVSTGDDDAPEATVERGQYDWVIGMIFCVLSSFFSSLGLILQKIAHNQNDRRPPHKRYKKVRGMLCSPMWWISLVFVAFLPFPCDFLALSYLAQSLIGLFAGLTLVLNQVMAPCMLKDEKLGRLEWMATGVILLGITIATIFGPLSEEARGLCDLLALLSRPTFVAAEIFLCISVVFILVMLWASDETRGLKEGNKTHKFKDSRWMKRAVNLRPFMYAFMAAGMATHTSLCFKNSAVQLSPRCTTCALVLEC